MTYHREQDISGPTVEELIQDIQTDGTLAEVLDVMRNPEGRQPVTIPTTGVTAAIATLNPGVAFKLLGILIHIGSALAAAETLTVTLDAQAGPAYDVVLFTLDLGTPDIRDVVIPFGGDEHFFVNGDQIVIALSANAGGDTWGCKTIHELV